MDSNKLVKLKNYIKNLGKAAVCFSGGSDSFLLLHVCTEVLGFNNAVGIFCNSDFVIEQDKMDVLSTNRKYNVKVIDVNLYSKDIMVNDKMRCAHCKGTILKTIINAAKEIGITNIMDGANFSDLLDYRPGLKVSNDLNILHPYITCKINKKDIIEMSEYYKLKTAKKNANACYATRIRTGIQITPEMIVKVKECENKMQKFGFKGFRLRINNDTVRLELNSADLNSIKAGTLQKIYETLKDDFKFVTLDLGGYKLSGSN